MSSLRALRLQEAKESVLRAAHFRDPQRKSFDKIVEVVEALPDDLEDTSNADLREAFVGLGYPLSSDYPDCVFELATGVGKRRLMGAIASYLIASGQSSNIVILAPRDAILDRLEQDADPASASYLFLDPLLVPEPNVCFRSNVDSFVPSDFSPNVFIISPQTIAGKNRRFARRSEFQEYSLMEYLRACSDVVVLSDEAHHIGDLDKSWHKAVDELEPRLHLGFTATAREDAIVLHQYGLAQCLKDGRYTKEPQVYAKTRDEGITDEDWDHITIDFALARLETKRAAISNFRDAGHDFPDVQPVLLISARDTAHADAVGEWLIQKRGFSPEAVHVTHSNKSETESEISSLLDLDSPGNPIQVVVQVDRLSEGWDVTTVYVFAPLRPMQSFTLTMQSTGRGLRLPTGVRTGDEELDSLDVVLFGRESPKEILEQVKLDFADEDLDSVLIKVQEADESTNREVEEKKAYEIGVAREVALSVPVIERMPPQVELDFDIQVPNKLMRDLVTKISIGGEISATASDDGVSRPFGDLKRFVRLRVCQELPMLDQRKHGAAVEQLAVQVMRKMGVPEDAKDEDRFYVEPYRLAVFIAGEIRSRYKQTPPTYVSKGTVRPVAFQTVRVQVPVSFKRALTKDAVRKGLKK